METNLRIFLSHPWHLVFNTVSISFTVTACAEIHYITLHYDGKAVNCLGTMNLGF